MKKCIHPPGYIYITEETVLKHCDQEPSGYKRWPLFICKLCGKKFTADELGRVGESLRI